MDANIRDCPIKYTQVKGTTGTPFTSYSRTAGSIKEQLSTPKKGDRYNQAVLIGYSFGGAAITKHLPQISQQTSTFGAPPVKIDLIVTIDPVPETAPVVKHPVFKPITLGTKSLSGPCYGTWLNYYQRQDQNTFLRDGIQGSPIIVFDLTQGSSRTTPIIGDINDLNTIKPITIKSWQQSPVMNLETGKGDADYLMRGHVRMPYEEKIYHDIVRALQKLCEGDACRSNPILTDAKK